MRIAGFGRLAALTALASAMCVAPLSLPLPARAELPACTVIPVELLDKVDSGKAHVGDRFRFVALDSVLTYDRVKVNKGTVGYGIVTYVEAAGAHAKPGELMVETRYLALPNGRHYQITVDYAATHRGSNKNAPALAGVVPIPFAWAAVGAFNYFHAGANITIPVGYRFAVTPVGELNGEPDCLQINPNQPLAE